jgi:tRNA threonylcarbamoyladenosine biosynthesis protein TsaE
MTDRTTGAVMVQTREVEETRRLGEEFGRVAQPGDVFLLQGPFGAGKTVFVQGLARGLGIVTPVTSPSFVIAAEHHGRLPLVHADLFRIDAPEEALLAGLYEYLEGDAVCAIEWPEHLPLPDGLPATRIVITPRDGVRVFGIEPAHQHVRLVALAAASGASGSRRADPDERC